MAQVAPPAGAANLPARQRVGSYSKKVWSDQRTRLHTLTVSASLRERRELARETRACASDVLFCKFYLQACASLQIKPMSASDRTVLAPNRVTDFSVIRPR
jgi:hypothetical protein